jgi:hypothetical protein
MSKTVEQLTDEIDKFEGALVRLKKERATHCCPARVGEKLSLHCLPGKTVSVRNAETGVELYQLPTGPGLANFYDRPLLISRIDPSDTPPYFSMYVRKARLDRTKWCSAEVLMPYQEGETA